MSTDSDALAGPPRPVRATAIAALAALALAALAGCASGPAERERSAPPAVIASSVQPDGSVRADTDDARVAQLWSAAEQAYVSNDADVALGHLYEAMELAPGNALLWSRAAEIQLDAEQPAVAENLAVKSNTVAGPNRALRYRNWLIIEHAREMRGDLLGVRSAHRKVQQFQY